MVAIGNLIKNISLYFIDLNQFFFGFNIFNL